MFELSGESGPIVFKLSSLRSHYSFKYICFWALDCAWFWKSNLIEIDDFADNNNVLKGKIGESETHNFFSL